MKPARALLAALAIMLVAACTNDIPTGPSVDADSPTFVLGAAGSNG
jgi:outer membrane biogenesis lipoprotein LolB